MSLNKFTDINTGKDIGLKIGCSELDCDIIRVNQIDIPSGGDLTAHNILATNKLEAETLSKDGVVNYTTPNKGQPNYSLHTDGEGSTFWSPDNTGNGDITYDGPLPLTVGEHMLFSSTDGIRVNKSKMVEIENNIDMGNLTLTNAGTINGIDTSEITQNASDIAGLTTDKLSIDGSLPMTGTLKMDDNNIEGVKILQVKNQIITPSNPPNNETKLYVKEDGFIYTLSSDGFEKRIGDRITDGLWDFQTSTLPSGVGIGQFNFGNITPSNVAEISISKTDETGRDLSPLLNLVNIGDGLAFSNGKGNLKLYRVSASPTIVNDVYTYNVIFESQTLFATYLQNEKVSISLNPDTNPFNQSLNTTDSPIFVNLNTDGNMVSKGNIVSGANIVANSSIVANGGILMNSNIIMNGNRITLMDFPADSSDAVNKAYLDQQTDQIEIDVEANTKRIDNLESEFLDGFAQIFSANVPSNLGGYMFPQQNLDFDASVNISAYNVYSVPVSCRLVSASFISTNGANRSLSITRNLSDQPIALLNILGVEQFGKFNFTTPPEFAGGDFLTVRINKTETTSIIGLGQNVITCYFERINTAVGSPFSGDLSTLSTIPPTTRTQTNLQNLINSLAGVKERLDALVS